MDRVMSRRRSPRRAAAVLTTASLALLAASALAAQGLLEGLAGRQDFRARRVSSYDRSGGNRDSIAIDPGQTAVLAELRGPGAIHHIWVTVAAEPFYGRKIVLRIYWDEEKDPSVEAPIGDLFGVGHGLNRNFASLPLTCSSEGRARNAFWSMAFRRSCRITATNEGSRPIAAFYYAIDYRELDSLQRSTPYFHAQYRQSFPAPEGSNYVLLEAEGRGHYVGCVMSVLQRSMGWWGEGDDMIFIDGETAPSLHGTGSEDYFLDAWGMREGQSLFYGCPLQEEDFQTGSKATVYRFHIPDPIPFKRSVRVTVEHGHANDRRDFLSSVAYWYQEEPHRPFPPLPAVSDRLPFALEPPQGLVFPQWEEKSGEKAGSVSLFVDRSTGATVSAPRLVTGLSSYYAPSGPRYPFVRTDGATPGTRVELRIPVEIRDRYDLDLFFLRTPASGSIRVLESRPSSKVGVSSTRPLAVLEGYAGETVLASMSIPGLLLEAGPNAFRLEVAGKDARSAGSDFSLVGYGLRPSARRFIHEWNLIGPFPAADMDDLWTVHPPEREIVLERTYPGRDGVAVGWRTVKAVGTGYVPLSELVFPNEQSVVYALAYVHSPDERMADLLVGSDDGVRVYVNGACVHTNPSYRAAAPDQDRVRVRLRRGWNELLLKVLQGAGGWGYYARFADPHGELGYALRPR